MLEKQTETRPLWSHPTERHNALMVCLTAIRTVLNSNREACLVCIQQSPVYMLGSRWRKNSHRFTISTAGSRVWWSHPGYTYSFLRIWHSVQFIVLGQQARTAVLGEEDDSNGTICTFQIGLDLCQIHFTSSHIYFQPLKQHILPSLKFDFCHSSSKKTRRKFELTESHSSYLDLAKTRSTEKITLKEVDPLENMIVSIFSGTNNFVAILKTY